MFFIPRYRIRNVPGRYFCRLDRIRQMEKWVEKLSQEEIQREMLRIRRKIQQGMGPEDAIEEAFAMVREVSRRILGLKHFEEQLLAGIALVEGSIVEMAAGEGKTLLALLPASVHGLRGEGVHVVTVNSYLARRDFEMLGPVYQALGITVGLVEDNDPLEKKRQAYQCDVTYGVAHTFGFDYLRDQLLLLQEEPQYFLGTRFLDALKGNTTTERKSVQRGHAFALVDEADSVLIDEARSPLIISGGPPALAGNAHIYRRANNLALQFLENRDYKTIQGKKDFVITPAGEEKMARELIQGGLDRPWPEYVKQALRARLFFHKDVDYLITQDQKVVIVDEFTGRRFEERTWSSGLHQAIEAKENLPITAEHRSLARITRQRYFRLYRKLSGMTGTAEGGEREFQEIYHVPCVRIPLHKPCQRIVLPPRIFISWETKWNAVEEEVIQMHRIGRPVLIGTRTIAQSEEFARRLEKYGLNFRLLNARQDKEEAEIIAHAGEHSAITIATNMAGRGAHIPLADSVIPLQGLHVIGVERHEARRIDNQLTGRCARQGQPGSARFFLSLEDSLPALWAPHLSEKFRLLANKNGELPCRLVYIFDHLQRKMEAIHLDTRKRLLHYDKWLEELLSAI